MGQALRKRFYLATRRPFAYCISEVQFRLGAKCTKRDSVFYLTLFYIKKFDIAQKLFLFKIRKDGDSVNLVKFIALTVVFSNGAYRGLVSQTKETLKNVFLIREEQFNTIMLI